MKLRYLIGLLILAAAGFASAIALAVGETTGTVTACADATVPAQTVTTPSQTVTGPSHALSRDGAQIATEPGDAVVAPSQTAVVPEATAHHCEVVTYTTPTVTVTTGSPPPSGGDSIASPRSAEYLSYSFDPAAMSHFQMNVGRGCNPHALDVSYASNSRQVNYTVPGKGISPDGIAVGPNCGVGGTDFAITYGGYSTLTSPISSPFPGIGTIRAYDNSACPGGDQGCDTANARLPINLDWSNASSIDTATWAAKVRAHFYQAQLATGPHPGIQGVFGDNFVWAEPYFTDAHEGTDTQWDDGAVRNASVLNSLLPSGTLQGGNGVMISCGFGDTYTGSVPGADCTRVGDTSLYEGVGGYVNVHNPARIDGIITQFQRWLSTPADDGNPKRAIWNVYGTSGTNNLGHVLTPQDQRIELAFASVAGAYLWAVNNASWDTTAIPGTASGASYAIPEMGDTATYPRGWLGSPSGPATKVASGQYKRVFSGGIVYANAASTPWSIDGRTVPAQDGLFVKTP